MYSTKAETRSLHGTSSMGKLFLTCWSCLRLWKLSSVATSALKDSLQQEILLEVGRNCFKRIVTRSFIKRSSWGLCRMGEEQMLQGQAWPIWIHRDLRLVTGRWCRNHPAKEGPRGESSLGLRMTCTALLPQFSQGFILNLLHGFLCNALDFSVQVFYALWSIHCLFPRQKQKQNQKHRNIPQFPIWEKPIFLLFLLPPFTQNCYHPEALTGANHPSCALLLQWNWKVCFTQEHTFNKQMWRRWRETRHHCCMLFADSLWSQAR